MAQTSVTSESLTAVAQQLTQGASSIETQLANLKSLVQGLVAGDWQGGASQAFAELYEQWDAAGLQLKESLEGISTQLTSAAISYDESENNITGTFRA